MKRCHGGNTKETGRTAYGKKDETVNFFTKIIMIFNDRCQPKYDTSDDAFCSRMLVLPFRSKFFPTRADMYASKMDERYKFLADPFVLDKLADLKPYILEWMLDGHRLYMERRFSDIPVSCKEWKQGVSNAVDNLAEWLEEVVEETGDMEDTVSYQDIKQRMKPDMRSRFKDKQHLLDKLQDHLQNYVKDTGKGRDRKVDIFKGYAFKRQGLGL